jgi:hypothetical protein
MPRRALAFQCILGAVVLAASCELFDVDKDRALQVTVYQDTSYMDVRNSLTMTISVPGSDDQTIRLSAHPGSYVMGNAPYDSVNYLSRIDIAWFGKKELTLGVSVGAARADITVSEDKPYFLYRYPSTITQ